MIYHDEDFRVDYIARIGVLAIMSRSEYHNSTGFHCVEKLSRIEDLKWSHHNDKLQCIIAFEV
jgi:hypothetical protein